MIERLTEIGEKIAMEVSPKIMSEMPRLVSVEGVGEFLEQIKDTLRDCAAETVDFGKELVEQIKEYAKTGEVGCPEELAVGELKPIAESVPEYSKEVREFGLAECSEAACTIFNEGVVCSWANLSSGEKKILSTYYATKVAEAFQLVDYKGIYFEVFDEPGLGGYNQGDGWIHISKAMISADASPFEIVDTITHELRHQYQHEAELGHHDVPEELRKEFIKSSLLYNYKSPSAYDPWGYFYNAKEIDARMAGETVVRNLSLMLLSKLG